VPFIGRQGWLSCTRMSVRSLEAEDHLLFAAMDEGGEVLDDVQCRRMFDLPATELQINAFSRRFGRDQN
jgi:hypothetical protein